MLSKNQRISRNRLNYLLKKGLRISNQNFQVKFSLNKANSNRYSVVVSKKVLKLATDRNHLRRQLYQAIETGFSPVIQNFDAVISVRNSLENWSFEEKQRQIKILLDQIAEQINHGQQSTQKPAK